MTESSSSSTAITGTQNREQTRTIIYPFGRYEIEVLVTDTGKFVGVTGVKVNAEFLSHAQKLSTASFHDVDKYYSEVDK